MLCCLENLFVISKVGIPKCAQGEVGGVEGGGGGFSFCGWAALVGEEVWNWSSGEVGLEITLCWLDGKGLPSGKS